MQGRTQRDTHVAQTQPYSSLLGTIPPVKIAVSARDSREPSEMCWGTMSIAARRRTANPRRCLGPLHRFGAVTLPDYQGSLDVHSHGEASVISIRASWTTKEAVTGIVASQTGVP